MDRCAAKRLRAGLPLLAVLIGVPALGAEPAPLEATEVTSRRLPEAQVEAPAAISVVTGDEVQRGRPQVDLGESLVSVPGLFLQNRRNFAQDLRLSSRGFGARTSFGIRGVRLFVDGIPATLPDGQSEVDGIDLGSVGRIEVMRGPASSLYGPAAGGVIHIESAPAPEDPFAETRVAVGEDGYRRYQLQAGGRGGPLGLRVSVSQLALEGAREQSRTRSSLVNAKLDWEVDPTSEVSFILNGVHSPRADDPGGLTRAQGRADRGQASANNLAFDAGESVDQLRLGLVWRKTFAERHELVFRNHVVRRTFENRLPFQDGGAVELGRWFAGGGLLYSVEDEVFGLPARLAVGADLDVQRDRRKRFDNRLGAKGPLVFEQDEDVTAWGVYLQGRVELLPDVSLTAGARYDRVTFDADDHFVSDGDDSGRLRFDAVSPSVALLWSPRTTFNLYGSLSTSFETPTTAELANPSGGGGFASSLDEQTAINAEIGVKGLLPGRLRYEVALFRVEVDDELVPFEVAGQPGRSFFRNAGSSTRKGLEVGLAAEPVAGVLAELAYTWSGFRFDDYTTPAGVFDGNRLPGVPQHQLHARLGFRHGSGLYATWEALWVDARYADDANSAKSGEYWVSGLRVGQRIAFGRFSLEPFFGVENLFDREYDDNLRLNAFGGRYFEPAPDRNVYGGLGLRFELGG